MFFRRLNWNVVGWLRIVSIISYAVIACGIASMIYHWVTTGTPLRLGLSFTGGTDVTAKFVRPVTQDAIVKALAGIKVTDAQVNTLTKPGETPGERYTIETQADFGNDSDRLWNALDGVAPVDRTSSSISTVGPSLASEYLLNALKALVIAIAIQFIYIAFRFGWNYIFGLVTIIALVRDSAMMIGIYSLADKRVDDAFLAAVLTVIGYSVMDTIVILDRIRENTKIMAGESFDKIVNTSILQTMARSVNTLATVVITLVALLALGGASLQNFGFALLVGICSGGYHSIFYSAPLVVALRERQLKSEAARRRRAIERGEVFEERGKRPRTVAEARAQARPAVDRAEVIAKRRERKERQKVAGSRASAVPARYRRKRADEPFPEEIAEAEEAADAYELGHEEIRLNLDEFESEDAGKK